MSTGSVFKLQKTTKLFFAVIFVFLIYSFSVLGQSNLYTQNFGNGTNWPTSWIVSPTNSWTVLNSVNSTGYTGASGGSNARIEAVAGTCYLTFNGISTLGYTNISVLWGGRRYTNDNIPLTFQWSSDGLNWNNVTYNDNASDANWYLVNSGVRITLPAGAGDIDNLSFRWFESNPDIGYRLDDFSIQGILIPTSPASFTSAGTSTFTVPDGVTLMQVEAWGGGGKGSTRSSNGVGAGGGGGAYSQSYMTVIQGTVYNLSVGAGSTTTSEGGDSYFSNTSTLLAKGGSSVPNNNNTAGSGGLASLGIGDIKFNGGNGATGTGSSFGGGGGSSAGTLDPGNYTNISNNTANGATAPAGGGNGGAGRSGSQGNGTAGSTPGGGGGGAYRTSNNTRNGGNGADGQIIVSWPVITTSTKTLTGFTYPDGYGPSSQIISFTVGGTYLTTNIRVIPTDTFEISLTSGASFDPQSLITLNVNNKTVPTTTIYVRMKAGLAVGSINPFYKINCSSDNAATKTITCSGTVTNTPTLTSTPVSLSGFNYNVSNGGPSGVQSFTVASTYLTSSITVTAPANYEVQLGAGSWAGSQSLPSTGGTINVRLKAGLFAGAYNENIVLSSITSTITVIQSVPLSGTVNQPTINVSTFKLGGFIYSGVGPSGVQTFTVSGQYLTAGLVLTAPTNFEIASTGGYGTSITLTPTSGTVSTTTISVRLKSGLGVQVYAPVNLRATSIGAIQQNVSLSGVVVNTATNISSNNTLVGFVYTVGNGPSVTQSFTVSGTLLSAGGITVSAPTNFEVSSNGSNWLSSFNIPGISVNAFPVYVRMKAGLLLVGGVATPYTGPNIALTSNGATVNVACSGVVIPIPSITAGLSGTTCSGSTITLTGTAASGTSDIYWTYPNGTNKTGSTQTLNSVTTTDNGLYTVTGSSLSAVNLLTNGDFSGGNTGFGTSYNFTNYGTQNSNQDIYTVGPNPYSLNTGFCNQAGGRNGTGGNQMIIDGATLVTGGAGVVAWSQSVSVAPGANNQFSYWAQNLYASNPAKLQLYVNGVPTGSINTVPTATCSWAQFITVTNSGSNTVLQLSLIDQTLDATGNDFTLDDLVFQQAFTASSSVNLIVNQTQTPSVSIAASANPLYSGGVVTFTATPVYGGTAPLYQWKVNGISVGINSTSNTYTYSPAQNDIITCVMTSYYPCISGNNTVTSSSLTAIQRTNFWYGGTPTKETDWGTAANWTANAIPSPGNDVEYATVENNTTAAINDLQLDVNRTIGNLVNNTTQSLIIPAGKGLIVNNTITTDGNPDRILIKVSSTLPNGSLIFHNAQNLPVQATVEMYSKASWNLTAGTLLKYQWQYFGIPVSSVVAEPTFYGSFVRKWDETGTTIFNHWIQQNNASVLQPFYGYEIVQEAPKTITFQGALLNSNFSVSSLAVTGTALFPGQHIFANPYTAAIDIRLLTFGSNTQNIIYMYNTGAYGIWESIGGNTTIDGTIYPPGQYIAIPKNLAGNALLPRQIPSMGTMLIRPILPVSTNFDFGINYNSVVMNNSEMQRIPAEGEISTTGNVGTIIDVKTKFGSDRMWLFTESTSTRGFDNGWDGQKIPGSALTPQLFAMETDGNYQVNTVPDIHDTELGFQAGQSIEDTLIFTHQNLEKRYAGLYLVDLIENRTIDITASGTQYAFVAESTPIAVKRFKIVTRPYEKEAADAETQVKIFSSQNSIFVQNLSGQDGECVVYDIAGRYLKKVPFGANSVTTIFNSLRPGAYIARAKAGSEEVSKRLIVK